MNRIHVNQTGGFPLETNTLNFMQKMTVFIGEAVAAMAGDFVIIKGCEQNGNHVNNGIVVVKKEVLPFKGGTLSENVVIRETSEQRTFESGESKKVYFSRIARFGSGAEMFKWSDFKRIDDVLELTKKIAQNADKIANIKWSDIKEKPDEFSAGDHTHTWGDITEKPDLYKSEEYAKMKENQFTWDSSQSNWDYSNGIVMYTPFGLGICFLELWRSQNCAGIVASDVGFETDWKSVTQLPEKIRPAEEVVCQVRLQYMPTGGMFTQQKILNCRIIKTGHVLFRNEDIPLMKQGINIIGYANYHVRRPEWKP